MKILIDRIHNMRQRSFEARRDTSLEVTREYLRGKIETCDSLIAIGTELLKNETTPTISPQGSSAIVGEAHH